MKQHLTKIRSHFQTIACFIAFLLAVNVLNAQVVTDPSTTDPAYNANKLLQTSQSLATNPQSITANTASQPNDFGSGTVTVSNNCFIPVDASYTAVPRNDDGSFGPIALPFTYSLYGTNYNQVWINTNGNLTFTSPFSGFTPGPFPNSLPMLAPFWADHDTRNPAGGQIYYKLSPSRLIVTWDSVGYFSGNVDRLNTYQVVLTNGVDPILPPGNNTGFFYEDMQWTSSTVGIGGTPATVGVNRGTPTFYIQIGRFNTNTSDYDGPEGANDGINYLDNKCFSFNGARICVAEICNGVDDDCDNLIDEGCTVYYLDSDQDGYGSSDNVISIMGSPPPNYITQGGDCNDGDASINPGATEICNFRDDDCDGTVDEGCAVYYRDADGDGYGLWDQQVRAMSPPPGYSSIGGDCHDWNASIHPGAAEVCNFVDDNCNGIVDEGCAVYYRDADGDGYGLWDQQLRAMSLPAGYAAVGGDCNDANSSIHPGATEVCNGQDDNCNGTVDESCVSGSVAGRNAQPTENKTAIESFDLKLVAYPNPSNNIFTVQLEGNASKGRISISVYNSLGKLVEVKDNLVAGQLIKIGAGYSKGTYVLQATQDRIKRTIKITKL